jgi:hypothetical protein
LACRGWTIPCQPERALHSRGKIRVGGVGVLPKVSIIRGLFRDRHGAECSPYHMVKSTFPRKPSHCFASRVILCVTSRNSTVSPIEDRYARLLTRSLNFRLFPLPPWDLFGAKSGGALPNEQPFTDASSPRRAVLAHLSGLLQWRRRFGILGAPAEIGGKFGILTAHKRVDKCSTPQVCRTG